MDFQRKGMFKTNFTKQICYVRIILTPFYNSVHTFQEVESDTSLKIDTIDYNTKLLVLKAARKQSGLYKIIAKNSVGQDEAELDLTILGETSSLQL